MVYTEKFYETCGHISLHFFFNQWSIIRPVNIHNIHHGVEGLVSEYETEVWKGSDRHIGSIKCVSTLDLHVSIKFKNKFEM